MSDDTTRPDHATPPPEGSQPLAPGATIDEIVSRSRYLSTTEAAATEAAATEAAASEPRPAPQPPPAPEPRPTTVTDADPVATPAGPVPATPAPKGRGRLLGVLGAGAAGLIFVIAKLGLKLFAVGAIATGVNGLFGSNWDKLPADQKAELERRFDAAVGTAFDGLSDDERQSRMIAMVTDGAARLDDASLASWERLDTQALLGADTATCAVIGRAWFGASGAEADALAVSDAFAKAYGTLPAEDFGRLARLEVAALEAAAAKSPPTRTSPGDDVMAPIIEAIYAALSPAQQAVFDRLADGGDGTDAEVCAVTRDVHSTAATRPSAEFAAWALWLSTP